MNKALLIIDYINDISHEDGKLASKGYAKYIEENNIFENLSKVISNARNSNILIVHIGIEFSEDYSDQPIESPLFGKANEYKAFRRNSWGTEFNEEINIEKSDIIIKKNRVSAFYNTKLDTLLKKNNVSEILIAGVSTDLAVSSTARDAHDRDYKVIILEDCCAAANTEDHISALLSLAKIATQQ